MLRRVCALLVPLACLLVVPSLASAKVVRWGSSLAAQPILTIPGVYAADAEFWLTSVAGGHPRAPVSGRIMRVKLKVGDDSDSVPLRFSVVKPLAGGGAEVMTTSTPDFWLPAHSPGVHVFDFSQLTYGYMPINKGDYLAIATPGVKPEAMMWYGAVAGSATNSFSAHGATQNPGFVWNGSVSPGTELLMQVVERPGRSYHFNVPH